MRRAVPHADRRPSNVPPPRALRSSGHRPPTRHPFLHPHRALSPAVLPLSPNPHPLHLAPPAPAFVPRAPRGPARRPPPPFPRRTPRGPTAPTPTGGRRQTGGWVGGTLLRPHVPRPLPAARQRPQRAVRRWRSAAPPPFIDTEAAPRAPPRRASAEWQRGGGLGATCAHGAGETAPPLSFPLPPRNKGRPLGSGWA